MILKSMKENMRLLYYSILRLLRRLAVPIVRYRGRHKFNTINVLSVDKINGIIKRRPPYAMGPDYNDLLFLWNAVRKRKPKIILEFGSGWSTYVIASALAANATQCSNGFLYSLDHLEEWANITNDTIPEDLERYCKIIYSPVKENEYEGIKGFVFSNIPDILPNMVFLDGPNLTKERMAALDLLYMESSFPDDFYLIIDKRTKNTEILKEKFKRKYIYKEYRGPFNSAYFINTFEKN